MICSTYKKIKIKYIYIYTYIYLYIFHLFKKKRGICRVLNKNHNFTKGGWNLTPSKPTKFVNVHANSIGDLTFVKLKGSLEILRLELIVPVTEQDIIF